MGFLARTVQSTGFRVTSALIGIAIPCLWLFTLVSSSEESVKIRNALVTEMGSPADFDWNPSNAPASFLVNHGPTPAQFTDLAKDIFATEGRGNAGEFARALAVARRLMSSGERAGRPIQSDNATAYFGITSEGHGYCADFSQVFNALDIASGMSVREWGIAFSAFGAGHAFNEIYDSRLAKWILIDSFHSLYFVDPTSREPLSVREVHDRLLSLDPTSAVAVEKIVPERFAFRSEALALDYYRRGMSQLTLIWGNNVFDYDQVLPVRWAGRLSRPLEQLTAIALGVYPKTKIYPEGVSDRDVRELFRSRDRFLLALVSLALAVLLFGAQLVGLRRRSRQAAVSVPRPADA